MDTQCSGTAGAPRFIGSERFPAVASIYTTDSAVSRPTTHSTASFGAHDATVVNPRPLEAYATTIGDGQYELLSELAGGGMSEVLTARDTTTEETVVLKRALSHINPDIIKKELQLHSKLRHEHIVNVLQPDLVDGQWIVLEHVNGGSSLSECEPNNDVDVMLQVALQTLYGLRYLHAKGILHRDIKPANVLLLWESQTCVHAKIADFGVSRECSRSPDDGSSLRTETKHFAGTKMFSAPETLRGELSVASDVWSWACTVAQMATGILPYKGENTGLPYKEELRESGLPKEVLDAILQCFVLDPNERPRVAELITILEEHCKDTVTPTAVLDDVHHEPTAQDVPIGPTSDNPLDVNFADRQAALANNADTEAADGMYPSGDETAGPTATTNFDDGLYCDDDVVDVARYTSSDSEFWSGSPTTVLESLKKEVHGIHSLISDGLSHITPMEAALRHSNGELVKLLLDNDFNTDYYRDNGFKILEGAVNQPNPSIVKMLFEDGLDADVRDEKSNKTVLMGNPSLPSMTFLLNSDACRVSTLDTLGRSTLSHVAERGHPDVVTYLIANGADVNEQCHASLTPLDYAISACRYDSVKLLLEHVDKTRQHSAFHSILRQAEPTVEQAFSSIVEADPMLELLLNKEWHLAHPLTQDDLDKLVNTSHTRGRTNVTSWPWPSQWDVRDLRPWVMDHHY